VCHGEDELPIGLTTPSALAILERKSNTLEKFMYLTQLRATNVHQFYRLLADNLKVSIPLLYLDRQE